jgi:hypothetical protein
MCVNLWMIYTKKQAGHFISEQIFVVIFVLKTAKFKIESKTIYKEQFVFLHVGSWKT